MSYLLTIFFLCLFSRIWRIISNLFKVVMYYVLLLEYSVDISWQFMFINSNTF